MANGFFQYGMRDFARGGVVWLNAGGATMRTGLLDTGVDTPNLATDDFWADFSTAIEEISGNMTLVDAAVDGIVDASDVTFIGTAGNQCEAIFVGRFVTNDADSIPTFYWDTAAGLPVTLGGDVTVAWDNGANKIALI